MLGKMRGIFLLCALAAGQCMLQAQLQPTLFDEVQAAWNRAGRQLIEMAEDFPEEKYGYRPTPEVRTFREILLHVATANYFFINPVAGREVGTATDDPPPDQYKSKAEVIAFLKKTFADGIAVMQEKGEAGMKKPLKHPFAERMVNPSTLWMEGVQHAGEHYGNLVVYYRLNKMVPPASRSGQ